MSIFEIEPYRDQVRPMMFAPRMDTRSKKNLTLPEQYNRVSEQVGKEVETFTKNNKNSKKGREQNTQKTLESGRNVRPENSSNEGRKIRSLRTMSKIYEGLSLLPQDLLARADQIKSKANYERIKDNNYIYFADVIKSSFIEDKKRKELEEEIFEDTFFKMAEDLPGQGNTSPHNLNIFHGISSNPFKKQDKKNFEIFQKNPYYSSLHNNSMTPRNILEKLDPGFWNSINDGIEHIQSTKISDLPTKYVEDLKNPYGQHTKDSLNWVNAPDPYTDNKVETFDINANFHTIITSQAWKNWDNAETFKFVNRLWEARSRVDDVLREIIGKAKHFPLVSFKQPEEKATALKTLVDKSLENNDDSAIEFLTKEVTESGSITIGSETLDRKEASEEDILLAGDNSVKKNLLLGNVQQWWDTIGESLNEAEVLPFGLLATLTPLMQTMMDWGNWGEEIAQAAEAANAVKDSEKKTKESTNTVQEDNPALSFKEKMISDYLNHTTTEFIKKKFEGSNRITAAIFSTGSDKKNNNLLRALMQKGIVADSGELTDKFNPNDPEFKLGIGYSEEEEREIFQVLRETSIGSFSIQTQDYTKINFRKRNNVKIKCSDNQYRTLPDILDLMTKEGNAYEKTKNSLMVYDTLFDIHAQMTNLTSGGFTHGRIENNETGRNIKVKVSEDSQWDEWEKLEEKSVSIGQWSQKQGAYEMEFETYEQADEFRTKIRGLIAILEPIVGTFSPEIKDQKDHPVRILVDNAGSMETVDMITETNPDYRIEMDHLFNKHYFKTDSWKEVSKFLSDKVFDTMKHGIFTRTTFNRMLRLRHKRQVTEYNDKKKAHEEREIQRIIQELRRYIKQRKERKKNMKRAQMETRKQHKEMLKMAKERQIENKKRLNRMKKSGRKKKA